MTDGIILIDKPANMTSFGVVARVRRVLSQQNGMKMKVGHCGTLDPFATGLLLLCVGKECKNAGDYMKRDKVYEATIRLGQTSSTGDPEGEIIDSGDAKPSEDDVKRALEHFTGRIKQTPPMHSAIKIDGQRAYHLARQGKKVEMPQREIEIYSIELLNYTYPEIKLRTHVSSGTYIRSLAQDIGEVLGVGAYCLQLRRLAIADWNVQEAQTLSEFGITE